MTFRCLPHSCKWSIRGVGFTVGVSPKRIQPPTERTTRAVDALTAVLADRLRDERRRRHWSIATLAERARLSRPMVVAMEHAQRASLDTWVALAQALGLELEMELVDPRRRGASTACREDPVHAAMGELEAAHLQRLGFSVAIDEPYQHFQFAGRADVVAWQLDPPAMLHIENRTRFPNVGETAGSWNAKRRWLAPELAKRLASPASAQRRTSWRASGPARCSTRCAASRPRSGRSRRTLRTASERGGAACHRI